MVWIRVAVSLGIALGLLLIIRVWRMRLHTVYRVFSAFLVFELVGSLVVVVNRLLEDQIDYRLLWLSISAPEWILTVWMVYALLDAVLHRLPGVLSFSKKLMKGAFLLSALIVTVPVFFELQKSGVSRAPTPFETAVVIALALDSAVPAVALLSLIAILTFVLWFPVQLPRNLVLFVFGLLAYFSLRTGALLANLVLPRPTAEIVSSATLIALPACYAYWLFSINPAGEKSALKIGHGWSTRERDRLMEQLESMNAALLRNSRM